MLRNRYQVPSYGLFLVAFTAVYNMPQRTRITEKENGLLG